MKKYLIALAALFCLETYSQAPSSILLSFNAIQVDSVIGTAPQGTLAPNSVLEATTWGDRLTTITVDVKNISGTTNKYEAKRYDMTLNHPATYTDVATAYFCFAGFCYDTSTRVSPIKLTLRAGKSASDTTAASFMLSADLQEVSVVGYSLVKYTFRNIADHNDSVQISMKYNDPAKVGITKINKVLSSSMEVYPNPAHDNAILKINSVKSLESKLVLYNALGSAVYSENIIIAEGKNQIPLNVENLPPGVYIANLKQGDYTITKKFIVD